MSRLMGVILFALIVSSTGMADDPVPPKPPDRLKKKVRPNKPETPVTDKKTDEKPTPSKKPEKAENEPSKDEPAPKDVGKDEPEPKEESEEDLKETAARIAKNMRRAEDRLAKKDAGTGTRQIHRDILKDLDALIVQNQRQQQQQQQQDQQQQQNDRAREPKNQEAREKRTQSSKQVGKEKKTGQDKEGKAGKTAGAGKGKREGPNKIADLYKDIWGHLPEARRPDMDAYSREKFMEKYSDLLKQYFATVAEKGRQKGD